MKLANTVLHSEPYFLDAIDDVEVLKHKNCVDLFDQNGYHLTLAEQQYLSRNGFSPIERRHEDCLRYDWLVCDKRSGAHINHSDLFERKGFNDCAIDQLHAIAEVHNPMLYKLIKMKPKWGIDISIDYVSEESVFEVFHYEWDSFIYEEVIEKKKEIEQLVLRLDWDEVAKDIWELRDEWFNLSFFDQTKWRTNYFGVSPEKFKNVIWSK
jgi:hypothetical protein